MEKPPMEMSYDSPKIHQIGPEISLENMQRKAPLKGLEWDCSIHAS